MINFLFGLFCGAMIMFIIFFGILWGRYLEKEIEAAPKITWMSGERKAQFINPVTHQQKFNEAKTVDDMLK